MGKSKSIKKRTGDYRQVRDYILQHYRVGEWLPAEEKLAELMGISRYAVLRGLQELSVSGFVRREKKKGTMLVRDTAVLAGGKSHSMSVGGTVAYVAEEFESYMHVEILRGIEEYFREKECKVTLLNANFDRNRELHYMEHMLDGKYSGCIALLRNDPLCLEQVKKVVEAGLPFVQLDRHSPSATWCWVEADHEGGAYEVVKHLISLGHRRIGYIGVPHVESAQARERGYRRALEEAGLEVRNDFIQYPSAFNSDQPITPEMLQMLPYESVHKLLAHPQRPTAIFLIHDDFAKGAMSAIRNHGLSIPQDMSLAGFNDGPESRMLMTPLTTAAQPFRQMGSLAAQMIEKMMTGEKVEKPNVLLPTRLIVRDSTCPPHRK